jgi:hypothetical protein
MGSVRTVFVRINSDPKYRAKLLRDPVGTLKNEGITLTASDEKELMELVRILKKHLPKLGELPRGYDALLDEVEGERSARKSGDPGPLII